MILVRISTGQIALSSKLLYKCSKLGFIVDQLVSGSVKQVILDAKVGPPLYEKGLAKDILSVVSILSHCQDLYLFVFYCASFGFKMPILSFG